LFGNAEQTPAEQADTANGEPVPGSATRNDDALLASNAAFGPAQPIPGHRLHPKWMASMPSTVEPCADPQTLPRFDDHVAAPQALSTHPNSGPPPPGPKDASRSAACDAIEAHLAKLSSAERSSLQTAVLGSTLITKNSADGIREMLESFPAMPKVDVSSPREPFTFSGVCATLLPDDPVMTTFNWKDRLFYGVILAPEKMVPVIAGNNDLHSDCRFEPRFLATEGGVPTYRGRKLSNAMPDGTLCHDMETTARSMIRGMKAGQGTPFTAGQLLTHNEVLVGQDPEVEGRPVKGVFVDLISNDFVFRMALRGHYPHLRPLVRLVPMRTWLQALQAMNLNKLAGRSEEFQRIRQTCIDHDVPFYVRTVDERGKVRFAPMDIARAESIAELTEPLALPERERYPVLMPILEWISGELHSL
jgi:hypothetical protein